MTAGIPCLGLSGLFVLLTAAVTPISRLVRGRGNRVRPVRVRALLALTAAIAGATWLTWTALSFVLSVGRSETRGHSHANFGSFFGVPIIVVSLLMLLAIVAVAEIAARLLPHRPTPVNPPIRRAHEAVAGEPAAPPRPIETASPLEDQPSHASPELTINSRRSELATQRARLQTARAGATVAWGTLLQQLDNNNEELRYFTRAFTTFAERRTAEASRGF